MTISRIAGRSSFGIWPTPMRIPASVRLREMRSPSSFKPSIVTRAWLGWVGMIPALGIFVGVFEESGFQAAGAVNAIGYILWSIWLIVIGICFVMV